MVEAGFEVGVASTPVNLQPMASASVVPASMVKNGSGSSASVDKLPEEMNDMKIRDDKGGQVSFCLPSISN